jgi:hypothetical protein
MGAISFGNVEPQQYDHIYYHDYHGWRDTFTGGSAIFNKFVSEGDELLKAVSFFTAADNVDYTVTIFDDFTGNELQNELSTKSGTIDFRGFHTIDLDVIVPLSEGEDFYVQLILSDGGYPYDRTSDVPVLLGASYRTIVGSSSNPDESYYQDGGQWIDFFSYDDPSGFLNTGNFCIKALTGLSGLKVTPDEDFKPRGDIGGPFTPQSQVYKIENKGISDIDYEITLDPMALWLTLTGPSQGTLGPAEIIEITIELNESVNTLLTGAYPTTLWIVNLTDHKGDTSRDLVLIIGEPTLKQQWLFESDPGWTTEADWGFGQPAGFGGQHGYPDPTTGFTSHFVYGYNLQGDYPNDLDETHLTSTSIDCSNWYGVNVKFMKWLGVESPEYDHAYFRASNDGINWTTYWTNASEITDNSWNPVEIDISGVADNQEHVYLRWTMGSTDGGWTFCGWNIDDVELFAIENVVTQIQENEVNEIRLLGNYPNPFNESTCIVFELPDPSHVKLTVYNLVGERIRTLLDQQEPSGVQSVIWDGTDHSGNPVKPGIYLYQLKVGTSIKNNKMIRFSSGL